MPEKLETVDMPGQEIFAAGRYKGQDVTAQGLAEMVRAHAEIGDKLQPFVKITHADGQILKDVPLRFGVVGNLRVAGTKLLGPHTAETL